MPRNPSGTYTLPVGNPVVSGTLIEASWANNTLADIGNEVTDSLSRSGEGAMLAPLRLTDGAQATPSLAFSNETQSGLYRSGVGEWWAVASGVQVQQYTSTGAVTRFAAGAVGTPSVSAFNDVNTGIWFPAADTVALSTAGVEAWRVNSSGNFGIGVTPAARLHSKSSLAENTRLEGTTARGGGGVYASFYDPTGRKGYFGYSGVDDSFSIVNEMNAYMAFGTNGVERMNLSAAGDLGLGVTPSAQGVYRAMQFGDYLAIGQQKVGTSQAFFGWNVRGSSTNNQYLYNKTGDLAALYEIFSDASHNWYTTSTAGTAGNTVSFGNPKMVLDVSGNLGIGITSPSYRVDARRTSYGVAARFFTEDGTGNPRLIIYGSSSGTTLQNTFSAGAANLMFAIGGAEGAGTEVARFDGNGNFGIGTLLPGQKLEVAGNQRFTGSQVGSKIENRQTAVSVATATTILDDCGALGRFVVVNGESAGNRFCDLVLCSTGVSPTVVSSFTSLGTPAARTYTRSGGALQLAMASGTYTVSALAIGY
jgi:hypothetical protein